MLILLALFLGGSRVGATVPSRVEEVRGLPFIRAYSFDEIGSVPRGLRIGFDSFGRFAVMYDGVYSVLNDSTWVERLDPEAANRNMLTTVRVHAGRYFYCGRGSWGMLEQAASGLLRLQPLVPADAPAWTKLTPFNEIIGTTTGVFFHEVNGVVYWDFAQQKNFFYELPRVVACFRVGQRVFASCRDGNLHEIVPAEGVVKIRPIPGLAGTVVVRAASLSERTTLLAVQDGRLLEFDGTAASPWSPQQRHAINGRVTAMASLAEGGMAISVADRGLFLVAADGSLRWSLPLPEFRQVRIITANEPGVLWVAAENAVHKIHYAAPITSFGQSLGLPLAWPHAGRWDGGPILASGGTLYELRSGAPAEPSHVRPMAGLTDVWVSAYSAQGSHLLVGYGQGVLATRPGGTFERIVEQPSVSLVEFIGPDLAIAVSRREILALRHEAGHWRECAPRIPGVGDGPLHTLVNKSLWIEQGGDRVARIRFRDGRLSLEWLALPWSGNAWTNLGAVGPIVVISGRPGQRAYYDETTEQFVAAPELDRLLARSPHWLSRVAADSSGTLWATHPKGVVTFTPENGDFVMDATTYELRNDSYPRVIVLPGDEVWIGSGRSLYHVERPSPPERTVPAPTLVSLVADHRNLELLPPTGPTQMPRLSYDDNSLSFRFFSGSYAWRTPPRYEYRLAAAEPWTSVDPGFVLRFPKLRDGAYQLEVRRAEPAQSRTPPLTFAFIIAPPWYRTPFSYVGYSVVALLILLAVARWINHRSLRRNAELEEQVRERTRELEVAMVKLGEETRNAATLAERSRLAGEIHDSLQQGLSGTMLHLETTLTNPALTPDLRAELGVMRKMLSYSREEVQQAVWNLGSPLLQNANLADALRELAGYLNAGPIGIKVVVPAEPVSLDPDVQHNLLRIAQEGITNAVKHAQAAHVGVTLLVQDAVAVLSVTDDGIGFNVTDGARVDGHFGLRGIRSRAKVIGASLQIVSAPGTGTTIQVSVPLSTPRVHEPVV